MQPPRLAVLVATSLLLSSGCGGPPESGAELPDTATVSLTGDDTPSGNQGRRADADGNGYPDSGRIVTGTYKSLYAEDGQGNW